MTTPAGRRQAGQVSETMGLSERRACRVVEANRSTVRYHPRPREDGPVLALVDAAGKGRATLALVADGPGEGLIQPLYS